MALNINIFKRNFTHQIILRSDVVKNIFHMQRLFIHKSHFANGLFNSNNLKCICLIDNKTHRSTTRYSTSTATTTESSWVKKFKKFFESNKSIISGKSVIVYGVGTDRINHKEFGEKFNMPNTFNTWFLVTEIHVWMLMVRAMAERDNGQLIRNNIVESLWSDALTRSKKLAPDDSRLIRQQIQELSGQFQYAIVAYDEGLTKDDKQLASAVWKRFFNSNCDNYEHIALMVKYIRLNISLLDNLSTEEFLSKRNIMWPSLKEVESGKYSF